MEPELSPVDGNVTSTNNEPPPASTDGDSAAAAPLGDDDEVAGCAGCDALRAALADEKARRGRLNEAVLALRAQLAAGSDGGVHDGDAAQLAALREELDALRAAHGLAREEAELNAALAERADAAAAEAAFARDCLRGDADEAHAQLAEREAALAAAHRDRDALATRLAAMAIERNEAVAAQSEACAELLQLQLALQRERSCAHSVAQQVSTRDLDHSFDYDAAFHDTSKPHQTLPTNAAGASTSLHDHREAKLQLQCSQLQADLAVAVGYGRALRAKCERLQAALQLQR